MPLAKCHPRSLAGQIHVIRDEMDATINHADGRRYTSKRKFEAGVRARGCTIIGNESIDHIRPPSLHSKHEVVRDIQRAMAQLRSR